MFFCPDCHVSNRSDAKFCRRCGRSRSDLERGEVSVAVAETPVASTTETPTDSTAEIPTPTASTSETASASTAGISVIPLSVDPPAIEPTPLTPPVAPPVAPSVHLSISPPQPPVEPESFTPSGGFDQVQVSAEAPELAMNIEQEVSLSAPPDLNSPECPSCWKALRATDKFCCWCGEAQPNRVLPFLKLCLECSTFLPEKANYCYSCGTDVGYSSRRKVRVPHELFKDEESEFFPRFDA